MTLIVDHISKSFGSTQVLHDVSMEIRRGEIVGLLGENGVGKTTLLKILAGISGAAEGDVTLDGVSDGYQSQVGYMSERNPLYPDMYIREYLEWVASCYGVDRSRVDDLVQQAGLSTMVHKKIGELSKGYRQRVGLTAALVHDPTLLILDEPINGLDPAQILQYRALISSISKDKIVLLSSHLMQEIEALCSRYILLEDGRVARDELLSRASDDDTMRAQLLVRDADLEQILSGLEGVLSYDRQDDGAYEIVMDGAADPRRELQTAVIAAGGYIEYLVPVRQDLDRLFTQKNKS